MRLESAMARKLTSDEGAILAEADPAGEIVVRTYHCREPDAAGWAKRDLCEGLVARGLLSLYGKTGSQYSPVHDVLWTYRITDAGRRAAASVART